METVHACFDKINQCKPVWTVHEPSFRKNQQVWTVQTPSLQTKTSMDSPRIFFTNHYGQSKYIVCKQKLVLSTKTNMDSLRTFFTNKLLQTVHEPCSQAQTTVIRPQTFLLTVCTTDSPYGYTYTPSSLKNKLLRTTSIPYTSLNDVSCPITFPTRVNHYTSPLITYLNGQSRHFV